MGWFVRPLHRGELRAVPREAGARTAGEQTEPVVELVHETVNRAPPSASDANSTHQTPPGKRSATGIATCHASLVLPRPPAPVNVADPQPKLIV
jgi:hypothetical protein